MLQKITLKNKHLFIAFLIAVAIASFFYFWHPDAKDDLFRYFAWLDLLRDLHGEEVAEFIASRGELITMIYAYIIAKIGNYGLFQFFPTIISLFIIQYIAIDYVSRNHIRYCYAWFGIFLFFCMYEIFMVASGVRSMLGFAVITLALYREYVVGVRNTWWMYVVAILIHFGMIIPTAVKIVLSLKNKKIRGVVFIIVFLLLLLPSGSWILWLLGNGYGNSAIAVSLYKLGNYLLPQAPLSLPYIYKIGKLLLIATCLLYVCKKVPSNRYVSYFLVIAILTIPMLDSYFLWYRMLEFLIIASPIVFIELFRNIEARDDKTFIFVILLVFALVGIRVQSTYYVLDEFHLRQQPPMPHQGWRLN